MRYAGQLNSFTYLRALLDFLHACGNAGPTVNVHSALASMEMAYICSKNRHSLSNLVNRFNWLHLALLRFISLLFALFLFVPLRFASFSVSY